MVKEKFIRYIQREKGYAAHTLTAYLTDLDQLDSHLREMYEIDLFTPSDLNTLSHKHLRNWIGTLKEAGLAHTSISRKLSSVKTYFRFLNQAQLVSTNPTQGLRLRGGDKKLPSFLKESETEYLLDGINFPETFEGIP